MVSGFISVPKPALWEDGGFPPHNQEDVNDRTSFYPQWLTLEYLSPDANQVLLTHFFHPHSVPILLLHPFYRRTNWGKRLGHLLSCTGLILVNSGSEPRHGHPFQYSYLENLMDRGAWWATGHWVEKSQAWLKQLSMHTCTSELQNLRSLPVMICDI